MIQSNRMSVQTPISLEGFEHLLDQVFEPVSKHERARTARRSAKIGAPNLVASQTAHPTADNVVVGPGHAMFHAVPSLYESVAGENAPASSAQLAAEVRLLKARLDYALDALDQARFSEKKLKMQLAAMEDQMKQVPLLFERAVKLRQLEIYLTSLVAELSNSLEEKQK